MNDAVQLPKLHDDQDEFSHDKWLIFEQATALHLSEFAPDGAGKPQHFLLFGRRRRLPCLPGFEAETGKDGLIVGYEVVAYSCDEDGFISDWTLRYETESHNFETAARKLRFQFANGLAQLCNCVDINL